MFLRFEKLTKIQKEQSVDKLFNESCPDFDFFLMLFASTAIITIGLLINNVAVIIGGMLIAPILSPILSFAMGIVAGDAKLMKRSLMVTAWSILLVVVVSFVVSSLTLNRELTPEIISRAYPSLAYFLIAMFSGVAVAYALVNPSTSEVLPGVAISVALIPPLASIGIAASFFKWSIMVGALGLFFLNLVGIIFAAILVFSLLNFHEVKKRIENKIKAEERVMEKEKEREEKNNIVKMEKTVREATELLREKKKNGQ